MKRVRDSSERILAEDLPIEALAPAGSVEVSLSGLSSGLSKTYVRSETAQNSPPPVPTANHRARSLAPPPASAARPTVPLGPVAAMPQASRVAALVASPKAGTAEFRPPSAVQRVGAFETPAEPPREAVQPSAQFGMSPELERLREDLAAARPGASKRPALAIAGLVAVIVTLVAALAATSRGAASTPAPTSLIDASEKPVGEPPAEPPPPLAMLEQQSPPSAEGGEAPAQPDPFAVKTKKGGRSNPDAKAVDDILKREYGGQRPVLGEGGAPVAAAPEPSMPSFAMRAAPSVSKQAPAGPRRFGITMGSEIAVKLIRPLDSRTPPCIVVAKLLRPFAPRGDILLPSGTLIYGTATAGNGRFEAQLTRLKLPDGEEAPFLALGYDASDKKPGLAPSRRVTASPTGNQGPGIGEQVIKSTANTALSKVAGNDGADVARGAGQTILNGNGPTSSASAQDALMLDAPADFTVFITEAF